MNHCSSSLGSVFKYWLSALDYLIRSVSNAIEFSFLSRNSESMNILMIGILICSCILCLCLTDMYLLVKLKILSKILLRISLVNSRMLDSEQCRMAFLAVSQTTGMYAWANFRWNTGLVWEINDRISLMVWILVAGFLILSNNISNPFILWKWLRRWRKKWEAKFGLSAPTWLQVSLASRMSL